MKRYIALTAALALCAALIGCAPKKPADGWQTGSQGSSYNQNGEALTGWQELDGKRYYFGPDGIMATGWTQIDGKTYCFGTDGRVLSGWISDDTGSAPQRYYLNEEGIPLTGWQELGGKRYYFRESGAMTTGWALLDSGKYYFGADGAMITGLMNIQGKGYYFGEDGAAYTGWRTEGDKTYYFDSEGVMAVGPAEIDGVTHHFTPQGIKVILVNPWNSLPEGYETELVLADSWFRISTDCADALKQMLADCAAAGHPAKIASGYRTQDDQIFLYNRKVQFFLDQDMELEKARIEAAKVVAVPGTSEHQLGLAVDLVDVTYPYLEEDQEETAAQKWLMAHCHEYGFILRYPKDTTHLTGIIYEPWHYRYVGVEIARDIVNLGITLEEYLDAVVTE